MVDSFTEFWICGDLEKFCGQRLVRLHFLKKALFSAKPMSRVADFVVRFHPVLVFTCKQALCLSWKLHDPKKHKFSLLDFHDDNMPIIVTEQKCEGVFDQIKHFQKVFLEWEIQLHKWWWSTKTFSVYMVIISYLVWVWECEISWCNCVGDDEIFLRNEMKKATWKFK